MNDNKEEGGSYMKATQVRTLLALRSSYPYVIMFAFRDVEEERNERGIKGVICDL